MRQQHGAYIERREPTMGTAQPVAVATGRRFRTETAWRRETAAGLIKLTLWIAVWIAVLCLSEVAARALQPRNPHELTYFFEALGTAAMLLITFWRTIWRLMWWFIALVVVLAVIKGAFLIVFAL